MFDIIYCGMKDRIKAFIKREWPLIAVVFIFITLCIFLALYIKYSNYGKFLFFSDEAYVNLAVARHLAEKNVYGLTPYEFSPSSSSPFWVLLNAFAFKLFGVWETIPLIFNILVGALFLILLYMRIKDWGKKTLKGIFLLLVLFVLPLPYLVFSGTEHLLFALFMLLILTALEKHLLNSGEPAFSKLFFLLTFASLIRYETLIIVGLLSLLFLQAKRWKEAFLVWFSLAPVVVVGLINISYDWGFFPAPVVLRDFYPFVKFIKAFHAVFPFHELYQVALPRLKEILSAAPESFLLAGLFLLFFLLPNSAERLSVVYCLLPWMAFLHLLFVKIDLLSVSYIVVAAIYLFIPAAERAFELWKSRKFPPVRGLLTGLLIVLLGGFLIIRGGEAFNIVEQSRSIYATHYQLAKFLSMFYIGKTVLSNSPGLINYFSDLRCVDLNGYCWKEVYDELLRKKFGYDKYFLEDLARKVGGDIAVLRGDTPDVLIPEQWLEVGSWVIVGRQGSKKDTILFFSLSYPSLMEDLRIFSAMLPGEVLERGLYLKKKNPIFYGKFTLYEGEQEGEGRDYRIMEQGDSFTIEGDFPEGPYRIYIKARSEGGEGILRVEVFHDRPSVENITIGSKAFDSYRLNVWIKRSILFRQERKIRFVFKNVSHRKIFLDKILLEQVLFREE